MIIERITMHNFRQFRDCTIAFAADSMHNVTLVLANNTTGKTTVANAFTWCLYGRTDYADSLLNKLAEQEAGGLHDDLLVWVEVRLRHRGRTCIFRRSQDCSRRRGVEPEFSGREVAADGSTRPLINVLELRNSIIPERLLDYVFIKAEQINAMHNSFRNESASREFSEAIRRLLGWEVVENLLKHLGSGSSNKKTAKFFIEHELTRYVSDDGGVLQAELERVRAEADENGRRLAEVDKQTEELEGSIQKLRSLIGDQQGGEERLKRLDRFREQLEESERNQSKLQQKFLQDFDEELPSYLWQSLIPEVLDMLQDTALDKAAVPDVTGNTIEYLLGRGVCLCGAELRAGTDCYESLQRLRRDVPPVGLGAVMAEFRGEARRCSEDHTHLNETYEKFKQDLQQERYRESQLQDEVEELERTAAGSKEIAQYEHDLKERTSEIIKLRNEIKPKLISQGNELTEQQQKLEDKLREAATGSEQAARLKLGLKYLDYIAQYLKNHLEKEERHIRGHLERRMNEMFSQVFHKTYRIEISSSYELSVNDSLGRRVHTSGSEGVFTVLAFLAAVLQVAREKPGVGQNQDHQDLRYAAEPYPLVLDAPLSAFDTGKTEELCHILPGLAEQIIILSKDTEGEIIKRQMQEHIGRLYTFTPARSEGRDIFLTQVEEVSV